MTTKRQQGLPAYKPFSLVAILNRGWAQMGTDRFGKMIWSKMIFSLCFLCLFVAIREPRMDANGYGAFRQNDFSNAKCEFEIGLKLVAFFCVCSARKAYMLCRFMGSAENEAC
jgi:hypothetical protein